MTELFDYHMADCIIRYEDLIAHGLEYLCMWNWNGVQVLLRGGFRHVAMPAPHLRELHPSSSHKNQVRTGYTITASQPFARE